MSRIGKLPINIPNGVQVTLDGQNISVKGPKGEQKIEIHPSIGVEIDSNILKVIIKNSDPKGNALSGLFRSLINNMVTGVTKGFEKKLEIQGVGFKAQIQGKKLVLNLGYSHPIEYQIPQNIEIKQDAEKKNILEVKGINKELVGAVSAKIRSFKKPEPYKGKGIRYIDEVIIKKAGKTAATAKEK